MQATYESIYLSPHLDDVALSCGGQVFMQHELASILVVTVMAGDPPDTAASSFAQTLHSRWRLDRDVVASRREEDREAMRILGADYLHWSVPDCIYRVDEQTGASFYDSNEAIFGVVDPREQSLVTKIAGWIAQLPAHRHLYVPLGVGNHVDHQITRRASEMAVRGRLIFYEEYPYVVIPGALQQVLDAEQRALVAERISVSNAAIQKRIEAISTYESQVSTFFRDESDLRQSVEAVCLETGGERVWRHSEL